MIASPTRRPLRLALAPALLAGVLALSACGGGDNTTTTNAGAASGSGSGTTTDQRSGNRGNTDELRACLKKQGVELPERPSGQNGEHPEGAPDGGTPPEGGAPPDGGTPPEGGLPGGGGAPPQGEDGQRRQRGPFADLSDEEREKLEQAMEECGGQGGPGGRPGGADGQGRGQRPDVNDADYQASIKAYVTCVRKNGYDLPDPDFSGDGPIFDPKKVDQQDATFQKASKACQSELRRSGGGQSGNGDDGKRSGSSATTTSGSTGA